MKIYIIDGYDDEMNPMLLGYVQAESKEQAAKKLKVLYTEKGECWYILGICTVSFHEVKELSSPEQLTEAAQTLLKLLTCRKLLLSPSP